MVNLSNAALLDAGLNTNERESSPRVRRYLFAGIGAILVGAFSGMNAHAEPIIQGAGDNFIAFEAEVGTITDPDGDGRTWFEIVDGAASGNAALQAAQSGTTATNEGLVTYKLLFSDPGDYQLFFRQRNNNNGGSDSLWIPEASDEISSTPDESEGTQSLTYVWHDAQAQGRYTIGAGDVGNILTFSLGVRERNFVVDRIVLWDRNNGNDPFPSDLNDFDALPNSRIPEPGTLALFGLGFAGLGLMRRRTKTA